MLLQEYTLIKSLATQLTVHVAVFVTSSPISGFQIPL